MLTAFVVLPAHDGRHFKKLKSIVRLLLLILAIGFLSSSLTLGIAHANARVVADHAQRLGTGTAMHSLSPGAYGYFVASFNGRAIVSLRNSPDSVAWSMTHSNAVARVLPIVRRNGLSIGLDRWFSDAITPVKAAVVLLC